MALGPAAPARLPGGDRSGQHPDRFHRQPRPGEWTDDRVPRRIRRAARTGARLWSQPDRHPIDGGGDRAGRFARPASGPGAGSRHARRRGWGRQDPADPGRHLPGHRRGHDVPSRHQDPGAALGARGEDSMEELVQRVKNIFQAAALATGCSVKLTYEGEPYTDLRNNGVLARLFEQNLRQLGIQPVEPVPWENAGSTDIGNVSHVVPAIHPTLAIAPLEVAGHSQAFLEASDSLRGYQAMIDAAKALAMTGADLLADPALVEQAKTEFRGG